MENRIKPDIIGELPNYSSVKKIVLESFEKN